MNTMIQMIAAWGFILTLMLVLRYRRTLARVVVRAKKSRG